MKKYKCLECGLKKVCVPVTKSVKGVIDYVCKKCYLDHNYDHYMSKE